MSGIEFTAEIDDAELRKFLGKKLAGVSNLKPFYSNVGEHLLNSVEDRFDTETSPEGVAWAALSPVTIAQRAKSKDSGALTILRSSGILAGSFNYDANSDQVQIGTPSVYGAIHHFGGQAGPTTNRVEIPARPILGLSSDDETAIREIAEDFLTN
ncbi:MAG: phage virion morphogenesis protein [Sulfitobacter sp.]|jgi:phage virion morphogenesis protein